MLNVGPMELLVVMVLGLIVLGPQKLPEVARQIGRVTSELRRMANGFQAEMRDAMELSGESPDTSASASRPAGVSPTPSPQARPPLATPAPPPVEPIRPVMPPAIPPHEQAAAGTAPANDPAAASGEPAGAGDGPGDEVSEDQ